MGLLDDAIREHLELKRRRGTDPTEMERMEREALGPVRRGPQEADRDEPAVSSAPDGAPAEWSDQEEAQAEPSTAPEPQYNEDLPAETDDESGLFDHETDREAPTAAPTPIPTEQPPAPPVDVAPPAPEAPTTPVPADEDYLGQETAEYDVEAEHALEHEEEHAASGGDRPAEKKGRGEDDVLEKTPEFLQDTPDHDRLWFEQRPPRDFDFDE